MCAFPSPSTEEMSPTAVRRTAARDRGPDDRNTVGFCVHRKCALRVLNVEAQFGSLPGMTDIVFVRAFEGADGACAHARRPLLQVRRAAPTCDDHVELDSVGCDRLVFSADVGLTERHTVADQTLTPRFRRRG